MSARGKFFLIAGIVLFLANGAMFIGNVIGEHHTHLVLSVVGMCAGIAVFIHGAKRDVTP